MNPTVKMTMMFMFNAVEINVMLDFIRACNAARTPFTLIDVNGVRRLCVFDSDQIEETLVNTDIYEIAVKYVELPLVGKDGYH